MKLNLVKALQEYMGAGINKIDPNEQDLKENEFAHRYDRLAQAAVPAVLTVLYKYVHIPGAATNLVEKNTNNQTLPGILQSDYNSVISAIAAYASFSEKYTSQVLNSLTCVAVTHLKNEAHNNCDKITELLNEQRHEIFTHLPASLQLGKTLDDTTIDDRTNKMEGPVSNLLHSIENIFASSTIKK